jgi:hypothetical protein
LISRDWAGTVPATHAMPRATAPSVAQRASRVLELQRLAGNRAVSGAIATAQREEDPDAPAGGTGAAKPPPEHVTGYLGLNPLAGREAKRLRKESRQDVLVSLNDPAAEKVLAETPEIFDFVDGELGIGLDDFDRWDKATTLLMEADPKLRDQLADLMRWFNRSERGEIVLERLVLSGHSNGVELWGDAPADAESKPGTMVIDRDLKRLTDVFPSATAQVQDVMFSACFSINAVELVIRMFPNLRTCWSYSKFSPDIAGGSGWHIATWAAATEGEGSLEKGDRRGSSALWTREKGFIVGDPAAAAVGPLFTEVVHLFQDTVVPMLKGDRDVPKPTLDQIYMKIQELIAHPGADALMKEKAGGARDLVLRLRFWPKVRERFGTEYGAQLQPAYDAIGVPPPDWSRLTRVALKAHLEAVKRALEAQPEQVAPKALLDRLLGKGLDHLDPAIIKSDWI